MGLLTQTLRNVRAGVAKGTAPVPPVLLLRVEFESVLSPPIGEVPRSKFDLSPGPSASLRLLEVDRRLDWIQIPIWSVRSDGFPFSRMASPRTDEVGLPLRPRNKECLGWRVTPTGRIGYSELRLFSASVQDYFRALNRPAVQELRLGIPVNEGDQPRNSSLPVDSPPLPEQFDYPFVLVAPIVVDCSYVIVGMTQVSENLFQPLGKSRADGKNYRPQNLRQGKLDFDQRPEREGYKKSYSERRNDSGGVSRQGMTIWDQLFPLLQPPPFDLRSQQQVFLPADLLPHQPEGVHFLASRQAALLGDGVQTGKTIQTIVAMKLLFQSGRIASALIVSPIPLLIHWQKQLEKWAPELWQGLTVVRNTNKEQRRLMWRMPAHVYATNYQNLVQDFGEIVTVHGTKGFDLIVTDEIQWIKNRKCGFEELLELGSRAKYRWGLSATPLENEPEDVVSLFEFLKPGLLRRNAEGEIGIREKIKPYFLRRRTADVVKDFKEPRHDNQVVEMEGEQLAAYETAFTQSVAELRQKGEKVTLTDALAKLQALKQLCNVHQPSLQSTKADWLEEILEEITSNGDKALVFSQYVGSGRDFLETRITRFGCINYGRAKTDAQKSGAVKAFSEDISKKVFLANPMTAGVGMPDLKEANYVIHFDHWWNPAIIAQANGRILGIGQRKDAFIVHVWVANSIEGRIQAILERKQGLFDRVIDSQTSVGDTGLTEEELFEVFGLTRPPRKRSPQTAHVTHRPASKKLQGNGEWTRADFEVISPSEFEELTTKLYRAMGFAAQRTKQSRDEGIDVIAIRDSPIGRDKLAVQCKHQAKPVGRPELQKLLGVVTSDCSFSAGVLITTTTFSADARRFVERNARLRLIDRDALLKLLSEYCPH